MVHFITYFTSFLTCSPKLIHLSYVLSQCLHCCWSFPCSPIFDYWTLANGYVVPWNLEFAEIKHYERWRISSTVRVILGQGRSISTCRSQTHTEETACDQMPNLLISRSLKISIKLLNVSYQKTHKNVFKSKQYSGLGKLNQFWTMARYNFRITLF